MLKLELELYSEIESLLVKKGRPNKLSTSTKSRAVDEFILLILS